MDKIKLTINGAEVLANAGDTVLTAAKNAGIEIPTLCHHESVKVFGACGICVVEAEGSPKLLRACSAKVSQGMVMLHIFRRIMTRWMLIWRNFRGVLRCR